jgi:hemerythrin-like domain-containing protein
LEEEHRYARRTVGDLVEDTEKWSRGEYQSIDNISDNLRKLVELYPRHIEKEDKQFFFPCQDYFTKKERENILLAGYRFDQNFTNVNYKDRMNTLIKHR